MLRLTNLDDVFFAVEERSIFAGVAVQNKATRLAVPSKKAIVNFTSERVLVIVSRGYRLVSNREALGMAVNVARRCFLKPRWNGTCREVCFFHRYCRLPRSQFNGVGLQHFIQRRSSRMFSVGRIEHVSCLSTKSA